MARNDGRLEPGQPLRGAVSARAWNRAQDAADLVIGRMLDASGAKTNNYAGPCVSVLCRNDSGQDMLAGTAKFVTGVEVPTDEQMRASFSASAAWNSQEFVEKYGATAFLTQPLIVLGEHGDSATKMWGVALEPILSGNVGRVAFAGIVPVPLRVENETDTFATCLYNNYYLHSRPYGEATIVWRSEPWESQSSSPPARWAFAYVQLGARRAPTLAVGTITSGDCAAGATCTVQLDNADGIIFRTSDVQASNKMFGTIPGGMRVAVASDVDGITIISKAD